MPVCPAPKPACPVTNACLRAPAPMPMLACTITNASKECGKGGKQKTNGEECKVCGIGFLSKNSSVPQFNKAVDCSAEIFLLKCLGESGFQEA
eukprot:scaffold307127_cov12-Tisochrysis_lutea.AAC.1